MPPAALRGQGGGSPWTPYMLRKPFVLVIVRFRVKARENPFRFEMMPSKERHLADRE